MTMVTPLGPEPIRQAMRLWASGVTIVTAAHKNERHGMTVSSFASVSLDPPLLLVALQRTTRTSELVSRAQAFGVTILSANQREISDRFAGRGDESKDRMEGIETETLDTGAPFIKGGLAYFDCRLRQTVDAGTSLIFMGEVVAARRFEGQPLVYHDRQYKRLS
ncbi:MAG TPA: flavin reductase family protein [Anaerolineales bacterium]|nr:flavin reductase family protein [Anaerolineales bacterium]